MVTMPQAQALEPSFNDASCSALRQPARCWASAPAPRRAPWSGGVVYTVNGAAAGSGVSRLTEKLDIHNQSGNAVTLQLAGLGFKPTQAALEVPDLSGLDLQGTTMVFFYGNAQTDSFTTPPYAPVMVLPAVSFSGFNPLFNQNLGLPAGARMTMVTEL